MKYISRFSYFLMFNVKNEVKLKICIVVNTSSFNPVLGWCMLLYSQPWILRSYFIEVFSVYVDYNLYFVSNIIMVYSNEDRLKISILFNNNKKDNVICWNYKSDVFPHSLFKENIIMLSVWVLNKTQCNNFKHPY